LNYILELINIAHMHKYSILQQKNTFFSRTHGIFSRMSEEIKLVTKFPPPKKNPGTG
jgi:hypothetical protein